MPQYNEKIHSGALKAIVESFEAMNGCFQSATFAPDKIKFSELTALLASIGYEPQLTLGETEKKKISGVSKKTWLPIGIAAFGFGMLGFIDDALGGEDRGFRGHLRALRDGRMTTGLLKLGGGAALALVLAAQPGFGTGKRVLADAILIALAANLGNLLDRAPGRVIKVSLLAWVPLAILAGTGPVGIALAPVMGAAAGVLPDDLREQVAAAGKGRAPGDPLQQRLADIDAHHVRTAEHQQRREGRRRRAEALQSALSGLPL